MSDGIAIRPRGERELPHGAERWRLRLAPLAVPLLLAVSWLGLDAARGPYWLGQNYDPTYNYLFGSLSIAEGVPSSYTDHPGGPLQALGGAVLAARYPDEGAARIDAVVARPEAAIRPIVLVLAVLAVAGCWAGGAAIARWSGSAVAALLAQSLFLVSREATESPLFLKPEALLLPLLFVAGALVVARALGPADRESGRFALPVALGFAIATKVTAAPLAVVLLTGPLGWRRRVEALVLLSGALLVGVVPWSARPGYIVDYVLHLATRRGAYGRGEVGLEPLADVLRGVGRLLVAEPYVTVALALLVGIGVAALLGARGGPPALWRRPAARWIGGWALGVAVLLLLNGKQPAPRFLIPGIAASGALIAFAWQRLAGAIERPAARRGVAATALVLVALAAVDTQRAARRRFDVRRVEGLEMATAVAAAQSGGVRVVPSFWASSEPLARWLGNRAAGFLFTDALEREQPGFVLFDVWLWGFRNNAGGKLRYPDLAAGSTLWLHGRRLDADGELGSITRHRNRSLTRPSARGRPADELEPIREGAIEALYAIGAEAPP